MSNVLICLLDLEYWSGVHRVYKFKPWRQSVPTAHCGRSQQHETQRRQRTVQRTTVRFQHAQIGKNKQCLISNGNHVSIIDLSRILYRYGMTSLPTWLRPGSTNVSMATTVAATSVSLWAVPSWSVNKSKTMYTVPKTGRFEVGQNIANGHSATPVIQLPSTTILYTAFVNFWFNKQVGNMLPEYIDSFPWVEIVFKYCLHAILYYIVSSCC